MWSQRFVVAALLALTLLFVLASNVFWAAPARADDDNGADVPVQADDGSDDDFVTGEVVVKLKPRINIEAINDTYGTTAPDQLSSSSPIYLLQLPGGANTENVVEDMQDDARLWYAEPNFRTNTPEGSPWRHLARGDGAPILSTDPAPYSSQYATNKLRLACAHGVGQGRGTVVAVLDTGAELDHPTLRGSFTAARHDFVDDDGNPAERKDGRDNDGDGAVDEMYGHGTHVAGVVGLAAPEAGIMPVRVLDTDGRGEVWALVEAVQYAVDNGADVINMSLGSARESELLEDAIEDLYPETGDGEAEGPDVIQRVPQGGVVVVASAGNANSGAEQYPAAAEEALAVASVDQNGQKSAFSNYGSWVDVAAPGDRIHSTFPTGRYAYWSGTSMAAPFVAGEAALLRGETPSMSAEQVGTQITATARPLGTPSLGAGHADAGSALGCAGSGGDPGSGSGGGTPSPGDGGEPEDEGEEDEDDDEEEDDD